MFSIKPISNESVTDKIKTRAKVAMGALATFLASAGTASAALTVDQQAAVDAIGVFVTDMTTVAWSFVLTITGALIAIKLYKKFVGRSS